jgi:hypothetical protein
VARVACFSFAMVIPREFCRKCAWPVSLSLGYS